MTIDAGPAATAAGPAVAMEGICRRFGTTVALDDVSFDLRRGEVHALLGENGAGKTTLMRILAGLDEPDAGRVEILGSALDRFDPRELRARGVALVQQHFTLVPTLTAGENLVLARPTGGLLPPRATSAQRVTSLVERYGLTVRADVAVARLSVGEQQRLEVLRALDADARILLLDEPTAVLTDAEASALLATCRALAAEGRAVVIITHRLAEVFEGCDRVTVLRGGRVVLAGAAVADHTRSGLASLMVGTEAVGAHERRDPATAANRPQQATQPRLRLQAVTSGSLHDFTVDVGAGEIVGIAGVDGNGQSDLEAALAGLAPTAAGHLSLDGTDLAMMGRGPRARVAAGIAYIPSDRYRHGLVRAMPLADNLGLGRVRRWRPRRAARLRAARPPLHHWDVRTAGPQARAMSLSGGNAQKLVLARELGGAPPRAVIACYPTRGLDPEAAAMIADRVIAAAGVGAAVVWIGAELDELMAVADRIVVLSGGRGVGPFLPPFDRAALGLAIAGGGVGRSDA